jgi:hypothetical protein
MVAMPRVTPSTSSEEQYASIRALRREAVIAGDIEQIEICDRALDGAVDAKEECRRVIEYAAAESAYQDRIQGGK